MRITEILTESQLEQLDEGPMLNKFGTAVGNVAGGVAKGIGAVAGGVAGLGSAFKKGFDRSKGIVSQGGDYVAPPDAPAPPKAGTPAAAAPAAKAGAPAAKAGVAAPQPQGRIDPTMDEPAAEPASTTTPPSAAEINAQGPKGTAPAKAQTGDAGKALARTTAVVDKQQAASQEKANQTVYAQVKANVDKLDKKGKQRILQMLQKSMSAPVAAPAAAPAAKAAAPAAKAAAPAKPGAAPPAGTSTTPPATAAPATAAAPANTMANTPVSATNTAAATNPNQPPPAKTGGKVAGQVSQTPGAVAKRGKRAAAKSASATGNKVMGNMVNQLSQQNASKINYGNALSEALAQRVETHKQKMFETGLAQGTISVFKK